MVIIQQQGGFRTSYDPETGKLVRMNCGDQSNGLNTAWKRGPMLGALKKLFGPEPSNGKNEC